MPPELKHNVANAYRPLIVGYMLLMSAFMITVMTFEIMVGSERSQDIVMRCLWSGIAIYGFAVACLCRKDVRYPALEILVFIANILVFAIVIYDATAHFDEKKYVYFIVMAMIFATSSVSIRQSAPAIIISFITLFLLVRHHTPDQLDVMISISLAGSFSAMGASAIMRHAIIKSATSLRVADINLFKAQQMASEAREQAETDSLTGLPNRRVFFDRLEAILGLDTEKKASTAILLLDLDGFKPVNDNYGYHTGDELLRMVGVRLSALCSGRDAVVARIGGDEFAIIVEDLHSLPLLDRFCEELLKSIGQPYPIAAPAIRLTVSIGVLRYDARINDPTRAMECVSFALNYAKKNEKGGAVIFSDAHALEMENIFKIDQTLRESDLDHELSLVFQPQFDVVTQQTVAFEALARWNNPHLGHVSPALFIKVAEQSDLISTITLILLKKTLAEISAWPEDIRVSFNLSVRDMLSDRCIDEIRATVLASGINPARIEFEVTESLMVADVDKALVNLNRLASDGHSIALDDFGVGYSNFGNLSMFPISKLKIDRIFLKNITTRPEPAKVMRSIIDLCKILEIECVIEGVETQEELEVVQSVKGRLVQGYLISKPLDATAARRFLAQNPPLPG